MGQEFDARIVIALSENFAKAVNDNGLQYTNAPELDALHVNAILQESQSVEAVAAYMRAISPEEILPNPFSLSVNITCGPSSSSTHSSSTLT